MCIRISVNGDTVEISFPKYSWWNSAILAACKLANPAVLNGQNATIAVVLQLNRSLFASKQEVHGSDC